MRGRILCVGDIHLGRRPSRLPDDLPGLDPAALGPAAAWSATVDAAIQAGVDSVLLAGDVVERIEDRFRAFGDLARGVERLVEAGIAVIGVTGNHDVEALPRLAKRLPDFRLLGAGGKWESVALKRAGEEYATLWGWSFPEPQVTDSPLAKFPAKRNGGIELGLLHADLDAHGSHHAPVKSKELQATGLSAWFLGHIHAPTFGTDKQPLGYLGSLSGLDPGEHGRRGPWMVEITTEGKLRYRQLPLAPLRYERIEIELSDLPKDPTELADQLHARLHDDALGGVAEALGRDLGGVRAVAVRATVKGSVVRRDALAAALEELGRTGLHRTIDRTVLFLEKIVDGTTAEIDLELLSRDSSYPGLLAQRILSLEADDDAGRRLVKACGQELLKRLDGTRGADVRTLDDDQKRELLLRSAYRALDALLAQAPAELQEAR